MHAMMTTALLMLVAPLLTHHLTNTMITNIMKTAMLLSIPPTLAFINFGLESTTMSLLWANTNFNFQFGLTFDKYSMLFTPMALLITWSILEFTAWYMAHDPKLDKFSKYLLLFLIAMLTLTTANNMLQLFIGWEGVGIMSFLLIGWWNTRLNANTAALQAIIYNRIGDIGLILSLAWLSMNSNTWEMQLMFAHTQVPTLPLLALILAAAGKSAQFGLHPWLPAAMEGPTPVSALLHSSTMVVAGVFLLVRIHPLLETNATALLTCLCLGALTTTFAALCAITQNDIKKIIAFSTSSQLGLMMMTLGLNLPELAFLHIMTHAFFKAMLFLCAGSIIHNLANEQDIRKMGGMQKTMPLTTSCITLGSLALMGTPFMAGFYTKDTIIEAMNTSHLNAWALLITMLATALTAVYSTRLIFYVQLHTPRYQPAMTPAEEHPSQTQPIMRLAIGSIIAGLIISSVVLPNKPQILTMTPMIKLAAIMVTLAGLICALDLTQKTTHMTTQKNTLGHITSAQLGFFNILAHRFGPNANMRLAQTLSLQLNDTLWYETLGPQMTKTLNTMLASKFSAANMGVIKTYMVAFLAFTALCLGCTLFYTAR